jgi:hypothetical protein
MQDIRRIAAWQAFCTACNGDCQRPMQVPACMPYDCKLSVGAQCQCGGVRHVYMQRMPHTPYAKQCQRTTHSAKCCQAKRQNKAVAVQHCSQEAPCTNSKRRGTRHDTHNVVEVNHQSPPPPAPPHTQTRQTIQVLLVSIQVVPDGQAAVTNIQQRSAGRD